jgi:hypothetical protein
MKLLTAALPIASLAAGVLLGLARAQSDEPVGYEDTPHLPESKWRVHDKHRPVPRVVQPGECGSPPSDATVLFDGRDLEAWTASGGPARWSLEGGAMVVNGTGSIQTRESFGDLQLHLEWAAPAQLEGESQGRGNSGVFLMGRYEVQILDSWQNRSYADGQAAALYGQRPPDVNASRPPGEWQSYDIVFRAPRFEGERLLSPARVTVLHNGVLVHDAEPFLGATTHRALPKYAPHPERGPIQLQDHGNPVRFRNVWVRELAP